MTEVTVQVAARRRAAVGRLMERGRRSSAAVAKQTEYDSEKLAHGQAVLDLQRAGHDHGRGRAWESVSRRVLARLGSGLVGRVAAGLSLALEGRKRSRLAEHGHDGRQPFLLCFDAILLRCWGGVNLGVGVTGLWRRPGPSVIASDIQGVQAECKQREVHIGL